jgi:hypothetical protein
MTTTTDIITSTMRLIGVLARGQTIMAEDLSEGLDALNQMLATWPEQGVNLTVIELSEGEELPYPANHMAPIRYSLAVELSAEYEKPLTQVIATKQND